MILVKETVKYVERESKARHTWIECEENENGVVSTKTIGMILPVVQGFLATARDNEETFTSFSAAKKYLMQQYEGKRLEN